MRLSQLALRRHATGQPFDYLKIGIASIAVGGLALLMIVRAVDLWQWRNDLRSGGAAHADNLAHLMAEYLSGAFAATDAALLQLQDHARRVGGSGAAADEWNAVLVSTRTTLTGAGSISVVDAEGIIRQSTQPLIVGQSRRPSFAFQRLSLGSANELVINPPLLSVTEPRHYLLALARRLDRPDGSFDGMVVVVFEPSRLRPFFKSVDVGRRGEISVLHPDGAVLFREPSPSDAIGEPAVDDPILLAGRRSSNGTLLHTLASHGAPVITAFHTIANPPLIVSVSLSEDDLLAEWWREVMNSLAVLGVFALIAVAGAAVAFRQIDRRIAAEHALTETEQRSRFALDAARVGTWEVDHKTGVANWSPTLEQLHGVAPGHFGRTFGAFLDLIHPDDRQEVERTIERATRDRTDADILYRTQWPDGTVHWMSGVGRTFYDDAGAPVRTAGVSMDVTDRHRLEEQYRQSQKLESIGQLAGGVAHDFNNLLTAILGHCELLDEALQSSGVAGRDSVAEIRRASDRASSLTRQLLAFGRRQALAPRVLDLGQSLTSIEPMLRRLIREDISIVVRVEPNLTHVQIDPGQMEQVILNLALNARDAMPDGGSLTLELTNVVLDEAYVRQHVGACAGRFAMLAVSDSGCGMDASTQARMFEPFFTTKEQGKGTGLGLATVYGIVKQSGGYIWVYSEPGHGTTFKVYLPSVDAPVDAPPTPVTVSTTGGNETILVVEDDEGIRLLIDRVLKRRGYRVLLAATPAEALDVARSTPERIDLVLSDVVLPEMSGPALLKNLAVNRPDVRVLYVSGYTDQAIRHRGALGSTTPFLQKPFTPAELLQKIREVLA